MNNLSLRQYKAIDLVILAIILAVAETITSKAANVWFPDQLYTLSPTIAVVCIVMMRWSGFAAIHAVVGGVAFCIASGASPDQFVIYCAGNLLTLLPLVMIKFLGKQKIVNSIPLTICYTLLAFLGAQIGRWIVGLFFGGAVDSIIVFILTDLITLLFSVVLILIARKVDGLFEDQKAYLIRTEAERMRERTK